MTIIHQLPERRAPWDMDIRLPQDTAVSGSPNPRKLRVDSVIMACPMLVTTINMIEGTKPGSRCFPRIYQKPPSITLACKDVVASANLPHLASDYL